MKVISLNLTVPDSVTPHEVSEIADILNRNITNTDLRCLGDIFSPQNGFRFLSADVTVRSDDGTVDFKSFRLGSTMDIGQRIEEGLVIRPKRDHREAKS